MSKRAPVEIFNLAFLDIISCAFGAVVMLILLAKNGDDGNTQDLSELSRLIQSLSASEQSVEELQGGRSVQLDKLKAAEAQSASNAEQAEALNAKIARAQNNVQQLTDQAAGLQQEKEQLLRAATRYGRAKQRDDEVGGIPVDSNYVVFIIDKSGSMKEIWGKLIQTMREVLKNHPKVKGFQVLADNGEYLFPNTRGKWLTERTAPQKVVIDHLMTFGGRSDSSPVRGIEEALRQYSHVRKSLALYVFGDELTNVDMNVVLEKITHLNDGGGKDNARIHGVGFVTPIGGNEGMLRYSTLMREVSRRNNGSFISIY